MAPRPISDDRIQDANGRLMAFDALFEDGYSDDDANVDVYGEAEPLDVQEAHHTGETEDEGSPGDPPPDTDERSEVDVATHECLPHQGLVDIDNPVDHGNPSDERRHRGHHRDRHATHRRHRHHRCHHRDGRDESYHSPGHQSDAGMVHSDVPRSGSSSSSSYSSLDSCSDGDAEGPRVRKRSRTETIRAEEEEAEADEEGARSAFDDAEVRGEGGSEGDLSHLYPHAPEGDDAGDTYHAEMGGGPSSPSSHSSGGDSSDGTRRSRSGKRRRERRQECRPPSAEELARMLEPQYFRGLLKIANDELKERQKERHRMEREAEAERKRAEARAAKEEREALKEQEKRRKERERLRQKVERENKRRDDRARRRQEAIDSGVARLRGQPDPITTIVPEFAMTEEDYDLIDPTWRSRTTIPGRMTIEELGDEERRDDARSRGEGESEREDDEESDSDPERPATHGDHVRTPSDRSVSLSRPRRPPRDDEEEDEEGDRDGDEDEDERDGEEEGSAMPTEPIPDKVDESEARRAFVKDLHQKMRAFAGMILQNMLPEYVGKRTRHRLAKEVAKLILKTASAAKRKARADSSAGGSDAFGLSRLLANPQDPGDVEDLTEDPESGSRYDSDGYGSSSSVGEGPNDGGRGSVTPSVEHADPTEYVAEIERNAVPAILSVLDTIMPATVKGPEKARLAGDISNKIIQVVSGIDPFEDTHPGPADPRVSSSSSPSSGASSSSSSFASASSSSTGSAHTHPPPGPQSCQRQSYISNYLQRGVSIAEQGPGGRVASSSRGVSSTTASSSSPPPTSDHPPPLPYQDARRGELSTVRRTRAPEPIAISDAWYSCMAPDLSNLYQELGWPSSRNTCWGCQRGCENSVAVDSRELESMYVTYRKIVVSFDAVVVAKTLENIFEMRIRRPANRRVKPGQVPIPAWSAIDIYEHFTAHGVDPFQVVNKRLNQLDNMIDATYRNGWERNSTHNWLARPSKGAVDMLTRLTTMERHYYSVNPQRWYGATESALAKGSGANSGTNGAGQGSGWTTWMAADRNIFGHGDFHPSVLHGPTF